MKTLIGVMLVLTISACSDGSGDNYEASLDCAANDRFTFTVVDGIRDISEMSETQRKVSTALLASTYVHAQSAGENTSQANEEINRRIANLFERFEGASSDQKRKMKAEASGQSAVCAKRFALVSGQA